MSPLIQAKGNIKLYLKVCVYTICSRTREGGRERHTERERERERERESVYVCVCVCLLKERLILRTTFYVFNHTKQIKRNFKRQT